MRSLTKIIVAFALVLPAIGEAGAVEVRVPTTGGAALRNGAGDLRALENRLQRQQYQQQQQQLREQDRLSVPLQRQAPQVPILRPGCQVQVYGNIRGCR